jgi:hypothetical protein
MPPVGGQSPAQNALALAQAAKLAADQQVNTAQGTLESAQSAVQTAQQTLTTAQETLVSATSALQEAERAVEDENQQKAELIRVAEQAVQEAEQNLQTAQQELDSARSALQELEQQISTAQGTVTTAEGKQQELNTLLLQAQAEVAQLMGNSSGMPPRTGNSSGNQPMVRVSSDQPIDLAFLNDLAIDLNDTLGTIQWLDSCCADVPELQSIKARIEAAHDLYRNPNKNGEVFDFELKQRLKPSLNLLWRMLVQLISVIPGDINTKELKIYEIQQPNGKVTKEITVGITEFISKTRSETAKLQEVM